jgi:RNA polymerase sigma factor (sigma-70 family)
MIDVAMLNRINEQNWEQLIPRLYKYTIRLLRRYKIRYPDEVLPKGNGHRDLVQQAITLVYEGKRQWNPEKYPDCFLFLSTSVIRSLVSNLYSSPDSLNIRESSLISLSDVDSEENHLENDFADPSNFEETIHEKELIRQAEQIIKDHDGPDKLLLAVFRSRLDESKNQQIAKELCIPISEVENVVKRIRRVLMPLVKQIHLKP